MRGRFASIALVPAAALVVTACGSEAGPASGASDDAVTGTAAPTADAASPVPLAGAATDRPATAAPSSATLAVPPEMRRASSVQVDPATCSADKVGDIVGKPADLSTLAAIAASTGQSPRLTGPDHVVTADHRPDRLNLWVVAGRIVEAWCG